MKATFVFLIERVRALVSTSTIIAMGISILLLLVMLFILFFMLKRKFEMKGVPIFIGAFCFIIFAMILEQRLHVFVLKPTASGSIALINNHPWLYVLYGVFAAGIFEETARFVGFHLLKGQYPTVDTSFAYGFGHGGIEVILVGVLSLVNSLILALLLQDPNGALANELPQAVLQNFQNTSAGAIYLSVIERFGAFVVQLCLSFFVWLAVNRKHKKFFFPVAILLHAIVDTPAAMTQAGLLSSISIVYLLLFLMAILLVGTSVKLYRKEIQEGDLSN